MLLIAGIEDLPQDGVQSEGGERQMDGQ